MDAHSFATMLRESVDTCFLLLGDLSQRLRGLIKEVDDLSLQSGTCRVAAYLLKMTPRESEAFELDIPKGVMASRLSVKPETFSRIIRSLQEQGILTVNRNLVTIHDLSALEATAEVCESGLDNRFPANDYPFIPGKP
jgi:CRP-like cAMP-binding protein